MTVRMARVGDILKLQREPVTIEADREYCRIGIYSWGKGFLHRPPVPGTEMGSLRYFTFPEDALVLSNIQAWEAAVAVSSPAEYGYVASNRFLPYVPIDKSLTDVQYVLHYFLSERGLAALRRASPGTQVRNRTLGRRLFEDLRVPLVEPDEQRRIAAHLVEIDRLQRKVPVQLNQAVVALDRSEGEFLQETAPVRPIGELCVVNPPPDRVADDDEIMFVPMEAVDQSGGTIVTPRRMFRRDLASGYKQFLPGDIIFARITPCMQNGKTAIYSALESRRAYGSTEFHVLRPRSTTDGPWIHAVLRTRWFREQAMKSFIGTAGQQRVPAEFMRSAVIPFPEAKTREEMLQQLRRADATRKRLRSALTKRSQLASSILPSVRNEAFNALR